MTVRDPAAVALENLHVVNLVQAMLGSVTPNIRQISVESEIQGVRLHFLLERDSAVDREEIADVAFEFEALQESDLGVEVVVTVSTDEAAPGRLPGRHVYGRKEA